MPLASMVLIASVDENKSTRASFEDSWRIGTSPRTATVYLLTLIGRQRGDRTAQVSTCLIEQRRTSPPGEAVMSSEAAVVVCALELLGRSASQAPPIRVLERPPHMVSANADAFVDEAQGIVYLIASAPAFRQAQKAQAAAVGVGGCGSRRALAVIAAIIAHEEWHLRHGRDEKGAYEAQISTLTRLGLGPDTHATHSVKRAMQTVLAAQRRRATSPLASEIGTER
jgi:hypothetical protein